MTNGTPIGHTINARLATDPDGDVTILISWVTLQGDGFRIKMSDLLASESSIRINVNASPRNEDTGQITVQAIAESESTVVQIRHSECYGVIELRPDERA